MASRIGINLKESSLFYPVFVGEKLLQQTGEIVRDILPRSRSAFVVTDSNVAPFYLAPVIESLQEAEFAVFTEIIVPGEVSKTVSTLGALYDKALYFSLKRSDVVVALGGGVVGDIAGYLAASYQRGVPFIQVPTTLLAQVDASIGGKVAINWRHLKNLIGAFHHPKAVLADVSTLETLSPKEFACGMAEVVKYGLIEKSALENSGKAILLLLLEQRSSSSQSLFLETLITKCCQIKAAVIEADPREALGIREILNLGHTFGHAYETLSQGAIPHGEAVSIGLVKAFLLAEQLEQIPSESVGHVKGFLQRFGLPVEPPAAFPAEAVLAAMHQDKKTIQKSALRLVLPHETLGKVQVYNNVPDEAVRAVL